MRKASESKVTREVRALLSKHGIKKTPVPVDEIASRLGIEVRYAPYRGGDVSGMIYRDEGRVVIGVNSLHHPNRQRFTIAHEIGHYLMHEGKEVHIDRDFSIKINLRDSNSSKAVDREEIEANRFASELLMPFELLAEDLRDREIDVDNEGLIKELAQKYKVSQQAMTFRVMRLLDLDQET